MVRKDKRQPNTCSTTNTSTAVNQPKTHDIFFGLTIASAVMTIGTLLCIPAMYAMLPVFTMGMIAFGVLTYFTMDAETWERLTSGQITSAILFRPITKKYRNIEHLLKEYRKHSLECVQTVIAIDFTRSNITQGERTFKGRSLHDLGVQGGNPYEQVIDKLGRTLQQLDDDNLIPVYGFGDIRTKGSNVFPLVDGVDCNGYQGVLDAYRAITPNIVMDGPTNFAPAIHATIEMVKQNRTHHVLIIITDGDVTSRKDTEAAIVEASHYPISIIAIGVGDGDSKGNFGCLETYDDELPQRQFDNFQFVKWADYKNKYDDAFTIAAMEELPHQMRKIKELKLL